MNAAGLILAPSCVKIIRAPGPKELLDEGEHVPLGVPAVRARERDQVAPPTINLEDLDCETTVDLCANGKVERKIDVVLSNSFGFGGTNSTLVLGKVR